jgi:tryptophan halogenase
MTILDRDSFGESSFVAMLVGLGVVPESYDPFVDDIEQRQLHVHFANLRNLIAQAAARMPDHGAWLDRNAKAPKPA